MTKRMIQPLKNGFSLLELLIYLTAFSFVVLGGLQLMSTFQISSDRVSRLADSALDTDVTLLRLNSLLKDSNEVDICNVYKTDTSLTDTQELSCGADEGNLRDAACLITRGNSLTERWGVEFDGDDHIALDFRSDIASNSDLSISMWIKDTGCDSANGCMLVQLGGIDHNEWWYVEDNNDRIALIALNDSGDLQLRLATQNRADEESSNESIIYPSVERNERILGSWNSGDWTHVVLTVEHDSDTDLSFGTTGSGDDIEDLSFDLYVNGSKMDPTNTRPEHDLDIAVHQLLLFGSYRTRSHLSGLIGPIQIFDKKLSDAEILNLTANFYLPTQGQLNLSMRLEDFGTDSIFTHPSSDIEFLTFDGYKPVCSTETFMPADVIRICRSFTDKESFEEQYESVVQEFSSGEAFMFAKDPNSATPWDDRPYALYRKDDADDFCLSSTDPGQTTDPEDTGWKRLSEFKYFPGADEDENIRFFGQLEDSSLYQLLISTEMRQTGGQGLASVGSLNVTRTLEDDALCQIAPDNINFSIPSDAEDSCDLRYATVLIQENFQPTIDLLYLVPDGGYNTNWSAADGAAPSCTTPVTFTGTETVNICRKTVPHPSGTYYLQYTFKDVPLLGDDGRATYDAETGTLKFDAGSGNTLDGEAWFQILKQVRYSYQDLVDESSVYTKYRTILFSLGESLPFYPPDDPTTPHYYKFVTDTDADSDIDWPDARNAAIAESNKFCGLQGYLVTITSEEENDFIFNRLSQDDGTVAAGWTGGTSHADWSCIKSPDGTHCGAAATWFQDLPTNNGSFRWVDGPEHGSIFYKFTSNDDNAARQRTGRYVKKDPAGAQCLASDESSEASLNQTDLDRFVTGVDPLPGNSNNICRPSPGPLCQGMDLWFHNFQVGTDSDGDCVTTSNNSDPVMSEPNNHGSEEYFVQITGNITGYGTWNDLPWDFEPFQVNGQHNILGHYVEYGGCSASDPCIGSDVSELAITAKEEIDVSALRRICNPPNR